MEVLCVAGLGWAVCCCCGLRGRFSGNLVASCWVRTCLASDQGTVAACHGRANLIHLVGKVGFDYIEDMLY